MPKVWGHSLRTVGIHFRQITSAHAQWNTFIKADSLEYIHWVLDTYMHAWKVWLWLYKLSWSSHINNTAAKANIILNFLKHNLSKCSSSVKQSAYLATVHPSLEYASVVWDPYHNIRIEQLEKVQQRAARWVVNNSSCHSSVTAMLQHLQ